MTRIMGHKLHTRIGKKYRSIVSELKEYNTDIRKEKEMIFQYAIVNIHF